MNLNFIGNTIDEIFGVKKKKDQVAAPQPIIRQQTLPSGLVVAKTPSQPTLTLKPAVNVKSPLTIGTPISMNNSIKIKAPTFTDNYSQPVSTTSRAKTLYQGIKQNQNIDDLSNRTGLGKQEILDFAKENGLDYGNKSILETAGDIAKGFVVDPFVNVAKDIAVKPAVTLARSLDPNAKKATQDALVAMDAAYKSGAISQAKLKEKFDDLMSDEISNGYKVTESGIEKMNPLGQTGQFAGQFVQAGSDVSNFLPFGIGKEQVKKLVMKPGEMAAKEILKTQAKQSAIIGTANTASDLLNDRGVTPESLAMNYAVPFVFGTVADTVHLRNKNAQFAKKSIDIIDKSYQATIKNGGVTIDLDGKSPTTGYVFSPDKTTELVVDKSNKKFNKKVISDFMTKNAGALMEKGNHLGIWEDDGKIYLDVSTVADRTPETIAKAQLAQQKGVFDLDNFETIDTGNIDENGVYSPLDEAVNIHNKYQEQIAGRIGETGDAGPTELPTSVQETPQGKNKVSFKVGQPASTPQVTKTPKNDVISSIQQEMGKHKSADEAARQISLENGFKPIDAGDKLVLFKGSGNGMQLGTSNMFEYAKRWSDSNKNMPKNTTSYAQNWRKASEYGKVKAYSVDKSSVMSREEFIKTLKKNVDTDGSMSKTMDQYPGFYAGYWRRADKFPNLIEDVKKAGYKGFIDTNGEVVLFDKNIATDLYKPTAPQVTKTHPSVVNYDIPPKEGTIRLYTNTKSKNVDSILKNGLKTKQRLQGYGADPSEGSVSWFETTPNLKGYGGNTVAVDVPLSARMQKVNDTQYTVFDDLSPDNIVFVDRPVFGDYRVSDIKGLVDKYGVEKVKEVFNKSNSKNITSGELDNLISQIQKTEGKITPSAPQVTKTEKNQVVINDKTMRDLGYSGNIVQESRGGSGEPPKRITSGEQDDIIKEVTKKVRSPLYQAKKGWAQMFNKAWVDEDQVVIDELRWIEKNTGQEGLVNEFIINSNNQRGSNAWANVYIKHNKNLNDAFGGMSKQEYNAFSDYVNARTELSTAKGRLTSRPVSELRQIVADGEEQFGSRFQSLNSYYKELADYAHKSGLITDEMHAKYKANDNYARIQRDMSDLADPYQGTSGRRRGISKSKMEQKRSGSEREILPAGDSAVTWAQTIFKEAARNKTCTHLVDTLMKTELANKLVDSTNVIARRKIFKTLSELKPVRDDLEKLIKQTVKELKKTNKVNFKRGQKILGTIKSKGGEYRNKAMKVANGGANLPGNSKKPAKLPTEADLEEAFYQFLDGNPGLLNDIEKFFTTKAQIKQLRQRLERAKDQFNQVKALRKDLYEDTLHMKDGSTKNKNIVSIKRNGIREVYEVSKEMKEAMDNINPFVINSFMRFIGAPARLFRAGTTGLEPTFIVRNYLKDQVGSAINSQSLIRTHNPARMSDGLLNATMDALGLNENPLWLEFQKFYGDMTSFDLTRNAKNTKEMVERIRGGKAAGVKQSMLHPIRTLEDYASITEKATRFQNFVGEYNRQIKAGMSHEDAVKQAALAAWQNSVDFSRAGIWGRIVNLIIPYWNPSIQGVRQMARVLKDRPIRSVFTASTLIGTPLILATAWNYSNQDSAEVYENIRETEKENNLVIVLPGTKVTDQDSKGNYSGVIKVPMAPGWKDVFMPTRRAMEAYYTKDPTKMAKMASDIIQAVSGPISTQSLEAFGGSLTPQFAKPWVQQAANKDLFSGNEIVPEWINEDTDADGNPIPESQKAYDGTSGTARAIGNLTNTSPIRVEKFIKDTTGKFGTEVLHGADTLAANAGLIPEDQIGGTSIAGSFKQSFNEARGIKNYNASEGSKYYENVKEVTSNMTGNELSAFNTLHPSKTNFLGDTIYETNSIYNASARQDVYNRFPKVFEADKKIDAKNRSEGKVGNPLFDLTEEQRKKVLFKEALPPGAKDPELSNLYSQEWYVDYSNAKQLYFDGIQKDQQKELEQAKESGDVEKVSKITESIAKFSSSDNPYPEASAELQSVMDYYNSLAKGTGERSAWIRSHPNEWAAMQNQYAAIDNWQNKQRAKYGLDATEGAEGQANGYTSYTQSSGYGSSGYPSHAKTPESYRVSINAGGQFKKPKVSSVPKAASLKVTHKYAEKPTVKLRKSKV